MARRHVLEIFVDGADQDLTPEAIDGARSLAFLQEPIEHADAVEVGAARVFAAESSQSARDAEFVGAAEAGHFQKGPGEMKRRRQFSALQHGDAAIGLDEIELAVKADAIANAEALVEV